MKQTKIVKWVFILIAVITVWDGACMIFRKEYDKASTWKQRLHNAATFRHREEDSVQKLQDSCTVMAEVTKGLPAIPWCIKANEYCLQILVYMQQEADSIRKLKY